MPYYVHPKDEPHSEESPSFVSRDEAYKAKQRLHTEDGRAYTVTLALTDEERTAWRRREWRAFVEGFYRDVPWRRCHQLWEPDGEIDPERVGLYNAFLPVAFHFAHLSTTQLGKIAYTPDDEHGYQDRQVITTPGRYLERYLSDVFTKDEIARYVATVKADAAPLQLARTPEEIVTVYRGGPSSCMAGQHEKDEEFRCEGHPVAVYGNSDLAVAYYGEMDHATARCVVWPEKQVFTRCYGDDALRELLKREGWHRGSLKGARIRAVTTRRGRYVMPYIDATESADLDGQWFVLRGPDDSEGEYTTRNTDGTSRPIEHKHCAHCECRIDEDESYCDSCQGHTCSECSEVSDDGGCINGDWYCAHCLPDDDDDEQTEDDTDCDTVSPEPVTVDGVSLAYQPTTVDGGRTVSALHSEYFPPFAVHPTAHDVTVWQITHLPTGLKVIGDVTLETGCRLATLLATLPNANWNFTSSAAMEQTLIERVPRLLSAFREDRLPLYPISSYNPPSPTLTPDTPEEVPCAV